LDLPNYGEADRNFYLGLLDANFPDSNVFRLIYDPADWYENDKYFHAILGPRDIVNWLLKHSKRRVKSMPTDWKEPLLEEVRIDPDFEGDLSKL